MSINLRIERDIDKHTTTHITPLDAQNCHVTDEFRELIFHLHLDPPFHLKHREPMRAAVRIVAF